MGDFLQEVKTTKKVNSNIEKFESMSLSENKNPNGSKNNPQVDKPIIEIESEISSIPLLTAVSSKMIERPSRTSVNVFNTVHDPQIGTTAIEKHKSTIFLQKNYLKQSPPPSLCDDAREILRSQPGMEDIEAVLEYLQCGIDGQHDFNIKITGPKTSQLIRVLVTITLPDLWPHLTTEGVGSQSERMKKTLIDSMLSVTGLEALIDQIRTLTRPQAQASKGALNVYAEFLVQLLQGSDTVRRLMLDVNSLYDKDIQRRLFWQGLISLLAGSKILTTTTSIANVVAESGSGILVPDWLLRGEEYSQWLARNIVRAASETSINDSQAWTNLGHLLRRSLSLGYKDALVSKIYISLLLGQTALWSPLHQLIKNLPTHDQKTVFDCILNHLARSYFTNLQHLPLNTTDTTTSKYIAGVAALVNGITSHNEYLLECAIDWVTNSHGAHNRGSGMRRALIAVLAQSQTNLELILERSLVSFSDKLQIQTTAINQQERLAHTILLTIGYLNRQNHASLKKDPIPSLMMNSVSNRLASSIPRTRLLGMIVGVGMSERVDEPSKVMNFNVEEMETTEVQEMISLTSIQDKISDLEDLRVTEQVSTPEVNTSRKRKISTLRPAGVSRVEPISKIMAIEEISSSSEDDDDLVPYQKPSNDPEDSDEDPTLINRDKPKAPIYISDLIKQLQSPGDKIDIISLALKTAPSLIRRKASFGTELSDNIHSLASALINLQSGMTKREHQQERLDALIACLVSQPEQMSKHLTNIYFEGDFSMSQRSTLLIAIGLGARELAGFTDALNSQSQLEKSDLFPSQRLPAHLQPKPISAGTSSSPANTRARTSTQSLIGTSNPVAMLTNTAAQSTIRPMAIAAADSQSGPEILKVTRISSRLSQPSSSQNTQRSKRMPKNIYTLIAYKIFLPLASPLAAIVSYSISAGRSLNTSLLAPSTLTLHLQTLTLLLNTLGPTGVSPPNIFSSITHETLLLVTGLRHVSTLSLDPVVLPAVLGLMLALVDVTCEIGVVAQERLLADPFGGMVAELVRWVGGLEDSGRVPAPGPGHAEGGVAWTVLAAGIQVRWWEMGKSFQGRMLGFEVDE